MGGYGSSSARSALLLVLSLAANVYAAPQALPATPNDSNADNAKPSAVPPHVQLSIVADVPDANALAARMLSWFRGSASEVQSNQTSQKLAAATIFQHSTELGVRVWVAVPGSTRARLFFAVQNDPTATPHYLVRDVELASGLDEVGMEQVAQIVYLSTLALWAGEVESSKSEVEQKLAPEAKPEPVEPSAAAREGKSAVSEPGHGRFGAEYVARYQGQEGIAHGPGLFAQLLWPRAESGMGGAVHADFIVPHQPSRAGVTIGIVGANVGAGLAGTQRVSRRASANAEVGLGVDVVHYHTVSTQGLLDAHSGGLDVRPVTYLSAGVRFELGATSVGLAALLAVQLLRTHYDIGSTTQPTRAITPNIPQPGLCANISW